MSSCYLKVFYPEVDTEVSQITNLSWDGYPGRVSLYSLKIHTVNIKNIKL